MVTESGDIWISKYLFFQLNGQSALGHQFPLLTNQKAGRQSVPMVIIMLIRQQVHKQGKGPIGPTLFWSI